MTNPFNRFYDTEISIYAAEENTYEKNGGKKLIGTVICDIQPCGADVKNREYGLSENRAYKIFTDINDIIEIGKYVLFGGNWYRIVRSENGHFGQSALMREVGSAD